MSFELCDTLKCYIKRNGRFEIEDSTKILEKKKTIVLLELYTNTDSTMHHDDVYFANVGAKSVDIFKIQNGSLYQLQNPKTITEVMKDILTFLYSFFCVLVFIVYCLFFIIKIYDYVCPDGLDLN